MKPAAQSDRVLLGHIRECIERIREYTSFNRDSFYASRLVQDAVVRNLQLLAESTQRLSKSVKETEENIPWRAISGFRNVLLDGRLEVFRLGIEPVNERKIVNNDLTVVKQQQHHKPRER